uniref:ZP domain-containing protein n=1 Tax=Rhabditophanes sp. KR3021 TaxID=114890 RepID=A0AC35U5H1_9BILA
MEKYLGWIRKVKKIIEGIGGEENHELVKADDKIISLENINLSCSRESIDISFSNVHPSVKGFLYALDHINNKECRYFIGSNYINGLKLNGSLQNDLFNKQPKNPLSTPFKLQLGTCGMVFYSNETSSNVQASIKLVFVSDDNIVFDNKRSILNLECLYPNINGIISQSLEVSIKKIQEIEAVQVLPDCTYQIFEDSANSNKIVDKATIGQNVIHKWNCSSTESAKNKYCMTIHNCFAKDENKSKVEIIDSDGCSIDKHLNDNLEYIEDLVAFQKSTIYKFADNGNVKYDCQITLKLKENTTDTCSNYKCT